MSSSARPGRPFLAKVLSKAVGRSKSTSMPAATLEVADSAANTSALTASLNAVAPGTNGGLRARSSSLDPFAALLAAAVEHPSAAQGLALAYAALERDQRLALLEAVLADTHATQMCPSGVLASLLAVEDDLELARFIASAISASGGVGLRCDATTRAMLAGDASEGAALLARPLHGRFVELLGLGWDRQHGVTHTLFEPLSSEDDLRRIAHSFPGGMLLEEMPMAFAMDVIAPALWHHRRLTGKLPEILTRFADLFEPALHGPADRS